jgi:hypothetical protein
MHIHGTFLIRQTAWLGVLAVLLAGCAYEWQKTGATPVQTELAENACANYAESHALAAQQRFDLRGETRKYDDSANRVAREAELPPLSLVKSRLFVECMERQGFTATQARMMMR